LVAVNNSKKSFVEGLIYKGTIKTSLNISVAGTVMFLDTFIGIWFISS